MKNKRFFIFFFVFFVIVSNRLIFASQEDFYGTWVGTVSDKDASVTLKLIISESTFAMAMTFTVNSKDVPLPDEPLGVELELIDWRETVNDDDDTKNNFPFGFILRIRVEDDYINSLAVYISNDNKQLTIPELNESIDEIMILIKQ